MGFLSIFGNKTLLISIIVGIIFAGLGAYVYILKAKLEYCNSEKKVLEIELSESQASVKRLSFAIEEQNAAVDKLKIAAAEREKKNRAEVAKAKVEAETYKKNAESLITRVAPAGVSTCDAANQLFNEVIRDAK